MKLKSKKVDIWKKFIGGLVLGFITGSAIMWFIMANYIINNFLTK